MAYIHTPVFIIRFVLCGVCVCVFMCERGHSGLYPHPGFHYRVCFVCVCVCVCVCVEGHSGLSLVLASSLPRNVPEHHTSIHKHTYAYKVLRTSTTVHYLETLLTLFFFLFSLLDFFVVLRTSIHDCAPSWKRFSPWFGILAASPPSRAIPAMLLRRCSHPLFSFSCPIFFLLSCNEWRRHPPALYQRCF